MARRAAGERAAASEHGASSAAGSASAPARARPARARMRVGAACIAVIILTWCLLPPPLPTRRRPLEQVRIRPLRATRAPGRCAWRSSGARRARHPAAAPSAWRRAGVARAPARPPACCRGSARAVWLIVAPRTPDLAGAGLPREPVPQPRLRGVGRALVRRPHAARLQPAVPAAGRAARRAGAGCARGAGVGRAVRADRRAAPTAARARWAAVLFALAAVGDVWIGPRGLRAGRHVRARRRCSR